MVACEPPPRAFGTTRRMSDKSAADPEQGSHEESIDYNQIEDTIDIAEGHINQAEEDIDGPFREDLEEAEDRLEEIEDAVDDDQDGEGDNPLGPVPATIDYIQDLIATIDDEVDVEAVSEVREDFEALEEQFDGTEITQTRWFATVDGIPGLFDQRSVDRSEVLEVADLGGNPSNYAIHALLTPTATIDQSDKVYPAPGDGAGGQPVDVEEYDHFKTAKEDGGVVWT